MEKENWLGKEELIGDVMTEENKEFEDKFQEQYDIILERLTLGDATRDELMKLLNYKATSSLRARISELREKGYQIEQRKIGSGQLKYWLPLGAITEMQIQKKKEKLISKHEKRMNEQRLRTIAQTELVIDACMAEIAKMNIGVAEKELILYEPKADEEVMVALLSDLQAGKLTKSFNMEVLKTRLRRYVEKIVSIADTHRKAYDINELVIVMIGDMIDGESIYPGQPFEIEYGVVKQVFILVKEVAEQLEFLSNHFKKINIKYVPGNHGRNSKFGDKYTNWDTVFYMALEAVLKGNQNINFEGPKDKDVMLTFKINGHKFLAVHGNNINMWMNIPWYGIIQKSMRWKGSLDEDWNYILLGHFHNYANFDWNDIEAIVNGTFVTDDDFGVEKIGMRSPSKQVIFGVHKKYGITWRYPLSVVE